MTWRVGAESAWHGGDDDHLHAFVSGLPIRALIGKYFLFGVAAAAAPQKEVVDYWLAAGPSSHRRVILYTSFHQGNVLGDRIVTTSRVTLNRSANCPRSCVVGIS